MKSLAAGEKGKPWIEYHTFGGTNPNYTRFYAWVFDANSAVPQYRIKNSVPEQYFVWRIKPREIKPLPPFLDKVRNIAPEIVPGKGDGLVTDARARLPFPAFKGARHTTLSLSHGEVLYDRALQITVATRIANLLQRIGEENDPWGKKNPGGKNIPNHVPFLRKK